MKIHSFILILVGLVVLSSGSYASDLIPQDFDTKTIAGTEFTLLSNTEQCLTNCEAWIEWDLTQGILTDVQIPIEKTSQFGFEIVKEKENTQDLTDFGIEVWEEIKGEWVKVSDSFYGFNAIQGKVYRLRVWGNRKATTGSNGVDWIPTFFGEEISEWAWWNNDWIFKIKVNLVTPANVTDNVTERFVIPLDLNSDISAGFWTNSNSDMSDLRLLDSTETIDMNYYIERLDKPNERLQLWFLPEEDFVAGSTQVVYLYYGNATAESNQKFRRDIYPDIYLAGYDFNETTGTIGYDVVDNNNLTHNNTPTLDSNGIIDGAIDYKNATSEYSTSPNGLLKQAYGELTIRMWFTAKDGWSNAEGTSEVYLFKSNAGGNNIEHQLNAATGKMDWKWQTDTVSSTLDTWGIDTYYQSTVTASASANVLNLYINADITVGGTLATPLNSMIVGTAVPFSIGTNAEGFDGNMDILRVYNRVLTENEIEFLYAAESNALAIYDIEEIGPRIDLNISTINGLSFSTHPAFAFGIDGSITIDFNVFQSDNNRLTIDLNYGPPLQGTGTVIVKDLNLNESVCVDQDWDDIQSQCSYSWNYSAVTDGNYAIGGLISNTVFSDYNASDANVTIANDLNIIVLAPIDEDTGLIIPNLVVGSTIGYSVKITTDHDVRFFDNMIDLNGFIVSFQSTPIIITIDVNVADEYYPRQYSIDFLEAMASYTLQPYLAPVSKSGNFIFFLTNLTTTGPLSDVTIIINGIVPGEDEVAIQEIVTDSAGTATIPLLLGTEYGVEFYYNEILVHTATVVPTASSLTYQVGLDISSTLPLPPPIGSLKVNWFPTTGFLLQESDGSIDINAQIYLNNKIVSTIQVRLYDTNGCLYQNSFFTAPWTDGNIVDFQTDLNNATAINIYTGLPCIFDTNTNIHSIFGTVDVNSTDGNSYHSRSISWQVVQLNNFQWNLWYRLGITANALNPPGSLAITSVISFFIVFLAVFAASKTVGNAFFTAMVGLILLGMCVYFGWFDPVIFVFIAFATVMYALYSWGRLG